jgi:hypothetical protein
MEVLNDFPQGRSIENTSTVSTANGHPRFAAIVTYESWAAPGAAGSITGDGGWDVRITGEGDTGV